MLFAENSAFSCDEKVITQEIKSVKIKLHPDVILKVLWHLLPKFLEYGDKVTHIAYF